LGVAVRVPVAVVCLVSAASVHDLTDQIPSRVQIAVPRTSRPPRIAYPPVQVFRFDVSTFELGLSGVEAAPGEVVRIYSPARTVVDLMRFRRRIGESIAHIALRRYLDRRGARPRELVELARTLGVLGPVRSAVDVLTAS
jgi:predicted transcriptional regulator of viral defense system